MSKSVAKTPPMGWNSWDCYGDSVNEEQLIGNAEYMAKNLKSHGWEYVVCDIQWSEPYADGFAYHNFAPLCMDEYSRLIPAENRFPSSAGGKGFKPIADHVHSLGLKFGIHIMRGIPRQAVHAASKTVTPGVTARDIALQYSVCPWNTDMYGVNYEARGAQEYYDSLFELYASWGVDYVKCDDIANTEFLPHNPYSARKEIEMLRKAIDRCGRDIVLSLSPGPAPFEEREHLMQNANMWRITGDFWDSWDRVRDMFDRCLLWEGCVGEHSWPDCDMLPIGHIKLCENGGRYTNFTKDEQITLMTLWCIFRSPLMIGAEMRDNDDFTLSLLTNDEVIEALKTSHSGKEVYRSETDGKGEIIRTALGDGCEYTALFNTDDKERNIAFKSNAPFVRDLWAHEEIENTGFLAVPSHGARFIKAGL